MMKMELTQELSSMRERMTLKVEYKRAKLKKYREEVDRLKEKWAPV